MLSELGFSYLENAPVHTEFFFVQARKPKSFFSYALKSLLKNVWIKIHLDSDVF